jgi:hypothetical protein
VVLLIRSPNALQALGLANYIFINEIASFYKQEDLVKKLDSSNGGVLQHMIQTFQYFQVDPQVMKLIPQSFHILNVPFISVLKQDSGLALIRDIPPIFTQHFVSLCAYCSSPDVQALAEYISMTRSTFI